MKRNVVLVALGMAIFLTAFAFSGTDSSTTKAEKTEKHSCCGSEAECE
ncbi:MAG: hypothetical protein ACKVRP_04635 [Bacteroidota bacterium]